MLSYTSLQVKLEIFYKIERMLSVAVIKSSNPLFEVSCMILVDWIYECMEVFPLLVHPDWIIPESGTKRLYRNVGKELRTYVV